MKTITLTTEKLNIILATTPNSIGTFIQLTQLTEPKILKKDRITKEPTKFKTVKKLTDLSVLVNTQYAKGVENQLVRENKEKSDYKAGFNSMPIDKSESINNFFGYFNGKGVIEYRPHDNSKPNVTFFADGKEINKSDLGDILPTSKKATNQGSEKEIHWRKLYTKNIKSISIGGNKYNVVNP